MYRDHQAAAAHLPEFEDAVPPRFAELAAHRWTRAAMGAALLIAFGATVIFAIPFFSAPQRYVPKALELGWLATLSFWPLIWLLTLWRAPKAPLGTGDSLSRWQKARAGARANYVADRLRRLETLGILPLLLGLSVALPLTIHFIIGAVTGCSYRDCGQYAAIALLASWPAHLIVGWRAYRVFQRSKKMLDEGASPPRFAVEGLATAGFATIGPAIATLCVLFVWGVMGNINGGGFSIFLVCSLIGGGITFFTGVLYLPLLYHFLLRRLVDERREIASMLQPTAAHTTLYPARTGG